MRGLFRWAALAAVLAAFAAPACFAAAASAGAAKPTHQIKKKKKKAPPTLVISPGFTSGPGVAISRPPVGLSFEYPLMAADLGGAACPPPALAAELLRLGSPRLGIGGQSQDFTAPSAPAAAPGPPANWEALTTYFLPASFWSQLHCLLSAAKDPLAVGLNARIGQLAWAEAMVAGAQQAATAGLQFSIGNEPDLYYLPNYLSLAKTQPGEEGKEVGLYLQIAGYLRQALGSQPLVGPELANPAHWQASLPGVISTLHPQTVGVHSYPLSVCRSPREATIHGLLAHSVGNAPRRLAWVVADARAAGVPAVISEANSVSCGGKSGVSDTSASAVWALRFVLAAIETGFAEVSFHLSGNPYDPFYLRGGEVVRRPIESALVALQQWLVPGTTLRSLRPVGKVSVATVAAAGRGRGTAADPRQRRGQARAAAPARGPERAPRSGVQPGRDRAGRARAGGRGPLAGDGPGQRRAGRAVRPLGAGGLQSLSPSGGALGRRPERRLQALVDRHRAREADDVRQPCEVGLGRDHHQELRAPLAQELGEAEQHVEPRAVDVARLAQVHDQAVRGRVHAVRELLALFFRWIVG